MNFNIIESHNTLEDLDEFIDVYNNTELTQYQICEKLDLTTSQYHNLRNKCNRRGLLNRRQKHDANIHKEIGQYDRSSPKHYYRNRLNGRYQIRYKGQYYATVKNHKQALLYIELMKEIDWDWDKRKEIRLEVLKRIPK